MHPKTQIRHAARDALLGLQTTGANVFIARTRPWAPSELPGLAIFTDTESGDEYSPPIQLRTMKLQVDIVVRDAVGANVDDQLDAIALQVERALWGNVALRALVLDLYLESNEPEVSGSGDQPIAIGHMVWNVSYQVDVTDLENMPNGGGA